MLFNLCIQILIWRPTVHLTYKSQFIVLWQIKKRKVCFRFLSVYPNSSEIRNRQHTRLVPYLERLTTPDAKRKGSKNEFVVVYFYSNTAEKCTRLYFHRVSLAIYLVLVIYLSHFLSPSASNMTIL